MSRIRKAVITAAGRGTRMYPATAVIQKEMLPLMDLDGVCKPTIQLIIEEALQSGIEEICLVVNPSNREQIEGYFAHLAKVSEEQVKSKPWMKEQAERIQQIADCLSYVVQETQDGYGHAVYQAKDWVGNDPFLLMLGDHVYTSYMDIRCAMQLLDLYDKEGCALSAVQQTPASLIYLFGTVCGKRINNVPPVYEIENMIEKPTLEQANATLRQPELPLDTYLCFFGLHILGPSVFQHLQHNIENDIREKGEFQFTAAQEQIRASGERYLAVELNGIRHDTGAPYGYVETQIALGSRSVYKDRLAEDMIHYLEVARK